MSSPLQTLPPELRNQIYRELLVAKFVFNRVSRTYRLEPAILRVNKHIGQEASELFRNENCWVLFTYNWFHDSLFPGQPRNRIVSRDPIDRGYSHDKMGSTRSLQVDVIDQKFRTHDVLSSLLVTPYELPGLCKQWLDGTAQQMDFFIRVNAPKDKQPAMLDAFRDIRGHRQVSFAGAIPTSLGTDIATLMTTPIRDCDDIITRGKDYESRGVREFEVGNYRAAKTTLRHGIECLSPYNHKNLSSSTQNICLNMISALRSTMAYCLIREGRLQEARDHLSIALQNSTISRLVRAKALFFQGLVEAAQGYFYPSIYNFMLALHMRPGYAEVDRKFNDMEWGFRMDDGRQNIFGTIFEPLLEPLRNQRPDKAVEQNLPEVTASGLANFGIMGVKDLEYEGEKDLLFQKFYEIVYESQLKVNPDMANGETKRIDQPSSPAVSEDEHGNEDGDEDEDEDEDDDGGDDEDEDGDEDETGDEDEDEDGDDDEDESGPQ